MKTRSDLVWEANRIVRDLSAKFPLLAPKLNGIRFVPSARMTRAAGTAYYKQNLIKLSLPFFSSDENFAKAFYNTVTHEIAHILVPPVRTVGRRNRDSHGFEWQMMHRQLGGTGERCHELELSVGFTARRVEVEIPCGKCGQPIKVSRIRAARARAGRMSYRHVHCPRPETPISMVQRLLDQAS
jgi:predicted SprT family Zn-dependent metalloprotease